MKLKRKLITTISMFCLVFATLITGVWAVTATDFKVDGNISFSAKGIMATISQGSLANASFRNSADSSTKLKEVVINTDKTEEDLQTEFASWSGLDLLFSETGDDATITFTITNNSLKATGIIEVNVSVNNYTMVNATASINKSNVTLVPNASQEFVITFSVTDKKADAKLSGFEILFDIGVSNYVEESEISYLTFSYDDATMTASVYGFDGSLSSVEIPSKIKKGVNTYTITSIENSCFYFHSNLISVTIPNSVTSIGDSAFIGCSGLTSITIGNSVTSIGGAAFSGCRVLTSVTIPDSVTSIGGSAFYGCSSLTEITIPEGVTSIGDFAFYGCSELAKVIIDSGTISSSLTSNTANGYVINYATTIYIKTGLSVGSYVSNTSNFTKATTSDRAGYDKYTKVV